MKKLLAMLMTLVMLYAVNAIAAEDTAAGLVGTWKTTELSENGKELRIYLVFSNTYINWRVFWEDDTEWQNQTEPYTADAEIIQYGQSSRRNFFYYQLDGDVLLTRGRRETESRKFVRVVADSSPLIGEWEMTHASSEGAEMPQRAYLQFQNNTVTMSRIMPDGELLSETAYYANRGDFLDMCEDYKDYREDYTRMIRNRVLIQVDGDTLTMRDNDQVMEFTRMLTAPGQLPLAQQLIGEWQTAEMDGTALYCSFNGKIMESCEINGEEFYHFDPMRYHVIGRTIVMDEGGFEIELDGDTLTLISQWKSFTFTRKAQSKEELDALIADGDTSEATNLLGSWKMTSMTGTRDAELTASLIKSFGGYIKLTITTEKATLVMSMLDNTETDREDYTIESINVIHLENGGFIEAGEDGDSLKMYKDGITMTFRRE